MTRKEATHILQNGSWWDCLPDDMSDADMNPLQDALDVALSALRPVSRERVEKVWKGEWNYSHTTETDHFAVVKCSKCEHEAFAIAFYVKDGNFCPACGAPMTDEAMQMVMERLEALHDTGN